MIEKPQVPLEERPSIPNILPVLPLRGSVIFPQIVIPLAIGQPRSIKLADAVMRTNRLMILSAQRNPTTEQPGPKDVFQIGTVARIHELIRDPNQSLHVVIQGLERVRLLEFPATEPYLIARLEIMPEPATLNTEMEAQRRVIVEVLKRLDTLSKKFPDGLINTIEKLRDMRQLVYLVASALELDVPVSQEILEIETFDAKLRKLIELVQHEIAVHELGHKIKNETQERMSKAQRDYFLREQMRAIQNELGEGENEETNDLDSLRRRIEEGGLSAEARREADRELKRLANTPIISVEHSMVRTYLDWLTVLPWNKLSGGSIDIPHARKILDDDHYDLEKIKERILEYLAVKKLRQEREATNLSSQERVTVTSGEVTSTNNSGASLFNQQSRTREPILCFVGPPGVGKTSLGQSIAKALGRKFIRISLGGMRDEAEIRGHRRTYVGALPGKIIQGIKHAEALDPVFMLDEIDKVGADWRGDPSSALLEVLDPAQNNAFFDHYLGISFDLSKVLFIATANTLDTIPPPLLDRMETVELSGYTDEEKLHIAEKYLIPLQLTVHGLKPDELKFDETAIRYIIRGYTREAGVRNLERQIATICRKVARKIAEGQLIKTEVTRELVSQLLGREYYFDEVAERTDRSGVATGLAWTPAGGD